MILKALSRKTASYKGLLNYMVNSKDSSKVILSKNIKGREFENWIEEFKQNEKDRLHVRRNCNKLLHDIVSFSTNDFKNITESKLQDIGKKYLELRGDNILALGALHIKKDGNAHIHFMISPIEMYTGRSIRISKSRLKEIKIELQKYHQKKYPELTHSIVNYGISINKQITEKEYQLKKRSNSITRKEEYKQQLNSLLSQSKSEQDFYSKIDNSGFTTYQRNGIVTGIIKDNKKYRFKTIGLDLKHLSIIKELEAIRNRTHNRERNRELER